MLEMIYVRMPASEDLKDKNSRERELFPSGNKTNTRGKKIHCAF